MRKRLISTILLLVLLCSTMLQVNASDSAEDIGNETKNINDYETLGDLIQDTDPAAYYSFNENTRQYIDALPLEEVEEQSADQFAENANSRIFEPFAAAISSNVESPSTGALSYSGTLEATETCRSLYLSATATEALTGTIVSVMSNTRANSKKVTVANVKGGLISGRRYKVAFYGVIEAPLGTVPPTGVVTSNKFINLK